MASPLTPPKPRPPALAPILEEGSRAEVTGPLVVPVPAHTVHSATMTSLPDPRDTHATQLMAHNCSLFGAISDSLGPEAYPAFVETFCAPREAMPDAVWVHRLALFLADVPLLWDTMLQLIGWAGPEDVASLEVLAEHQHPELLQLREQHLQEFLAPPTSNADFVIPELHTPVASPMLSPGMSPGKRVWFAPEEIRFGQATLPEALEGTLPNFDPEAMYKAVARSADAKEGTDTETALAEQLLQLNLSEPQGDTPKGVTLQADSAGALRIPEPEDIVPTILIEGVERTATPSSIATPPPATPPRSPIKSTVHTDLRSPYSNPQRLIENYARMQLAVQPKRTGRTSSYYENMPRPQQEHSRTMSLAGVLASPPEMRMPRVRNASLSALLPSGSLSLRKNLTSTPIKLPEWSEHNIELGSMLCSGAAFQSQQSAGSDSEE